MSDASFRPSRARAVLASVLLAAAASGSGVLAAPSPPSGVSPAPKPPLPMSGTGVMPPDAADRLQKAGLNPRDPDLARKLKALAAATRGAFARAHVMSTTASARGPAKRPAVSTLSVASARAVAAALPVPGNVVGGFDDTPTPLGSPYHVSSTHGNRWPGRYFFLVETKQPIATKGGPGFSLGNTSLSYGCSAALGIVLTRAAAADDPNFTYGLAKHPPANGSWWYYVDVEFSDLPIGQERSAQATFTFENATAHATLVLEPTPGTATLSVTVDHTPQLTGVGNVYPWGSTGLTGGNAKLGSPGTERVGGGNWQVQTQGDDLVGVGVGLGPGWKVVSTQISSAVSAVSPQDLSPNNTWRGATVTTPPSGSDLRTAVHWHYSGIDSLDYTVEWSLAGPMGQRPLLTMAKYGSCDQ
jgi:hypothetical protein